MKSLPTNSEGLNVYFHVVNLSAVGRNHARDLANAAKEKQCNLLVSYEQTEVRDRAYFACSRFLRLPEWLDRFKCPVLLMETDCEIDGDPREWMRKFSPDCVGMLLMRGPAGSGYLPWRAFWAGMIFTPANRQGRIFAKLLRSVIGYLWKTEHNNNWWIDQNALYVTHRLLQRHWSPSGFHTARVGQFGRIKTGSEMKIRMLGADPEVAGLIAQSLDWEDAVSRIQLTPAGPKPA